MKITYYGTSASEAWPALFCDCRACELARKYGGKNIRSRSQALVDDSILLDFPPDTNYHAQVLGLTHSHHDHFFPYDICMRNKAYAEGLGEEKLLVCGDEVIQRRLLEAAKICGDFGAYITFHLMQPFETIETADGYTVTSLLADHNQPEKSLLYLIEKDGKALFYAHDTGIFPEETWKFIEGRKFDYVSLDCTALSRDWRQGHMGFQAVDEVCERLRSMHCIDEHTILTLNHLAHFADFTHEKICGLENPKGYQVAYDGCFFEF